MTGWRVITVRQPWAWAIAHGGKNVENRSACPTYRGPIVVRAGAAWSRRGEHDQRVLDAYYRTIPGPSPMGAPNRVAGHLAHRVFTFAAAVAVADLVDAHPAQPGCCTSPWAETSYTEAGGRTVTNIAHLTLADVRPVDFPMRRGVLGLVTLNAEEREDLADALNQLDHDGTPFPYRSPT